MAYSGEDLFRNYRKTYVISPFQASQVSPLGYDLRIGHAISLAYPDHKSLGQFHDEMKIPNEEGQTAGRPPGASRPLKELTVDPGQSFLVVTIEQVFLSSKVLATVQAKASVSIQGLFLNPVTVDPNFAADEKASGRLILFMNNVSGRQVKIREKDGIATLIMHEVSTETSHLPEKSGFEAVLKALEQTYDSAVTRRMSAYTDEFLGSRGLTEFARDRRAVRSLRSAQHARGDA
jgi:deoxycytidine triphosphate deaminase